MEKKRKQSIRHSPRLANAIKRALAYARDHSGWWCAFSSDRLGRLIIDYAYGADKYDVLYVLCPGIHGEVITYARGDIRHRKRHVPIDGEMLMLALLTAVVVLCFIQPL